jgi:hypothetical protein
VSYLFRTQTAQGVRDGHNRKARHALILGFHPSEGGKFVSTDVNRWRPSLFQLNCIMDTP